MAYIKGSFHISEPPKRFSLMDMFKARHGLHEDSVHNNSDFLSHSMSVSSVMSCFLHSFTGYVEDPEAADADMPATSPTDTVNPKVSWSSPMAMHVAYLSAERPGR